MRPSGSTVGGVSRVVGCLALLAATPAALADDEEVTPPGEVAAEPEEAGPTDSPVRGSPVPGIVARFAAAQPLAVNRVTDIRMTESESWYRIAIDAPGPVVLRIGGLNTWLRTLRVYDSSGARFQPSRSRWNRPSAWHGMLTRGTYYVSLGPKDESEEPRRQLAAEETEAVRQSARPPENTPGGRPGIWVSVDPVGPGATPRQAAQLGLDYLQADVPAWQNEHLCNGCHMQAQALMGMAIAKRNGYRVEERPALALGEFLVAAPIDEGPGRLFTGLGLKHYASGFAPARNGLFLAEAGKLAAAPADEPHHSGDRPPVEGGVLSGSAMAAEILASAKRLAPAQAQRFKGPLEAALAGVGRSEAKTVQDQVMRIIAASEAGEKLGPTSPAVVALVKLQNQDGGFGEQPGGGPSNAYGTGQALYALRLGGVSAEAPELRRAVEWLMDHQLWNGSWPLVETACESDITHAMWATIGLAGSVEAKPGRLAVIGESSGASPKLELILDASGSMRRKIGSRTMLELAKESLGQVIDKAPGGLEIALRVYGHRIREGQKGACEDSELVSELALLDRAKLKAQVAAVRALGTTPIAFSLSRAGEDLLPLAGEKMIILLTDGKEECKGDPVAAVEALPKKGLKLRLNVVGFALNDPGAKQQMRQAAELTGGRFFDARDGEGLKRSIEESLSHPFQILDATGGRVGGGSLGGRAIEVRPGSYSVVLEQDGAPLKIGSVKVEAGKLTQVRIKARGGRASLEVLPPMAAADP